MWSKKRGWNSGRKRKKGENISVIMGLCKSGWKIVKKISGKVVENITENKKRKMGGKVFDKMSERGSKNDR